MKNDDNTITIIADEQLLTFLDKILCTNISQGVTDWKDRILRKSPDLAPYLVQGLEENLNVNNESIRLICDIPKSSVKSLFPIPMDQLLQSVAGSIMTICALGGGKALVDLLKTWVEARQSRIIEIRKGEETLKIQGIVSEKEIQRMYDMFNKETSRSKIIKPALPTKTRKPHAKPQR